MNEKRHFIAMVCFRTPIENPIEIPIDACIDRLRTIESVAKDAVYKAGLTTHRNNPETFHVKMIELFIENGKMERKPVGEYDITPPFAPMTEEEFNVEMKDALSGLPESFQKFVRRQTYDRGDTNEGRLSIIQDMADDLHKVVKEFAAGLGSKI